MDRCVGWVGAAAVLLTVPVALMAQISSSAYRVAGQSDLNRNGVGTAALTALYGPGGVAVDRRPSHSHLYVSDTLNNRVLGWRDSRSREEGAAANISISLLSPNELETGNLMLRAPIGLAVDPGSGALYVADSGNDRVLRFRAPFDSSGRVVVEAVFGGDSLTAGEEVSNTSLRNPQGVFVDLAGYIWIADSGNHRVLRFPGVSSGVPTADLVIGQANFPGADPNGGESVGAAGLDSPARTSVDPRGALWVSDSGNNRVLRFDPPFHNGQEASLVLGQPDLQSRTAANTSGRTLLAPGGIACSGDQLYIVSRAENRVLVFAIGGDVQSGMAAVSAFGQPGLVTFQPNVGTYPAASASGLFTASDIDLDGGGYLYVADTGNNRVVAFPLDQKAATRVWGQPGMVQNRPNLAGAETLNHLFKAVVDQSAVPHAMYVADTRNHRVLIWKDADRFRNGDPADGVIGQPGFQSVMPNAGSGSNVRASRGSLWSPRGLAVGPDGTLYVADAGNNRVLRFPRSALHVTPILPDAVLGQPDFEFNIRAAPSDTSLFSPTAVAVAPDGDLFVSDTGNNRVLEFPAGAATGARAIRVFGQPGFNTSSTSNTNAQTLNVPAGLTVDPTFALYIADSGSNRVLIYTAVRSALAAGAAATQVLGQRDFQRSGAAGGAAGLDSPLDVAVGSSGTIAVADAANSRVLFFPSRLVLPMGGGKAIAVLGQADFEGVAPNSGSSDGSAKADTLLGPTGLCYDRNDTLYIADSGNNRLVHFLRQATLVNEAHLQEGVPLAPSALARLTAPDFQFDAEVAGATWPTSLQGLELIVDGSIGSPLKSVKGSQISFQIPTALKEGAHQIAARRADTGEWLAGTDFQVAVASPGLFTSAAGPDLAVLNSDRSPNGPSNPASPGAQIHLFGTGQGAVSPPVPDGEPALAEPGSTTVATPTDDGRVCITELGRICVVVGNTFAPIQFSGLAPGMVGVWTLTIRIPESTAAGEVPVRAVVDGILSNIITVSVR